MISRRHFLSTSAAAALLGRQLASASNLPETYRNPIMAGDHPDASPIRVGNRFYLTHSSFDYAPGLVIYRSEDLVNWRAVNAALPRYKGNVYAPYLCQHGGKFYIYFPADNRLRVTVADDPEGVWSEPVDLGIFAIDPAHISWQGRRFLFMADGKRAELSADGLSVIAAPEPAFTPWPLPTAMRVECVCLEGPKLIERNGWFYLNVAEGGTGGPATSHSVISMRSRTPLGPWEFSPYNPIVHTESREDRWLNLGHGRLVDTAEGKWYMTVHGYENGYRALGRQMSLLPVEWTNDDWFRLPAGTHADDALPMPVRGAHQMPAADPTDDFRGSKLGLQWAFWHELDPARFTVGDGRLELAARGEHLTDSPALTTAVGGHSYTVEMDVEITEGCKSGLLLFYNPEHATGLLLDEAGLGVRLGNDYVASRRHKGIRRATLRVVNDRQEVDFWYRLPGGAWERMAESAEVSGMHHNVLGGFLDLRPAVFAAGTGKATFRGFRYWPEARVPQGA